MWVSNLSNKLCFMVNEKFFVLSYTVVKGFVCESVC